MLIPIFVAIAVLVLMSTIEVLLGINNISIFLLLNGLIAFLAYKRTKSYYNKK